MVHLRCVAPGPLVATFTTANPRRSARRTQGNLPLRTIQGSLSARRVERKAPLLASMHRIATGALAGLGISMLGLSALTIHWQNQWSRSYAQLEASKALEHRLQESAALLEHHHLGAVRGPSQLVPTSSEKLIHLPQPQTSPRPSRAPLFAGLHLRQVPSGY